MQFPSWHRYPGIFTILFAVLLAALFVIEHINGRFWLNDFKVYYGAGEALLNGAPLYGVAHGLDSGVYKYAPALALVYALFAMLPYGIAASIQFILIALAFLDGSRRIDRLVRGRLLGDRAPHYLPLFLIGLVCVVHLHRELHLGNINMMLLWLLVVSLERMLAGRHTLGGIVLGAAILAKPHFIILLPLLALRGRFRSLAMAISAIAIGLIVPALFLGWVTNIAVHGEWLAAMAQHNDALIYSGGDDHRAVNTIYSFLHRAFLKHMVGAPNGTEAYLILAVLALLFGAFVVLNKVRESKTEVQRAFAFEFLFLVALVPSITLTDTEHFLLAMPVVALLVHQIVPKASYPWLPYAVVPLLFAYGGNWEDALGSVSDGMIHYGILGIGSFGTLILAIYLWWRSNHEPYTPS